MKVVVRKVNWDDVEERGKSLPEQLCTAKVVAVKDNNFSNKNQYYMPTVTLKIIKTNNKASKGKQFRCNFTLGTEEDPKFLDPATRGPGLSDLKVFLKKAGVRMTGVISKDLKAAVGKTLTIDVSLDDDGKYNRYEYFSAGERNVSEGSKKVNKKKDEIDEEEDDEETDEDEDEDDDEEEEEEDDEDEDDE